MAKKPSEPKAKAPKSPGRPTKCTPEVTAIILDAIRKGHYIEDATRLAKISDPTFYSWKQRGEAGEEPFAEFLTSVKEAEAEAKDHFIDVIREGGTGFNAVHWTSAMTFMERRWPRQFGKRDPYREDTAGIEKRNMEREGELLDAKVVIAKRGIDPDDRAVNIILPSVDEIAHDPEPKA